MQKTMSEILTQEGFEVFNALDGEIGVQMAREKKPDIILMDFKMPGMDGVETFTKLREDQETKDELKLYREAIRLYRSQNWDLAELQFINLQKLNPQRYLYEMYAKRIAYFRLNPPGKGWDGVYTYESK